MEKRVCETISSMLKDRGSEIPEFNFLDEVNIFDNVMIVYINSDKLGVQHVKVVEKYIEEYKKTTNILIYKTTVTSFAKNAITDLPCEVELFSLDELCFNITKHYLVPEHILLSSEEKKRILNKYMVSENKMPMLNRTDPVCRYFNAKPGTMFKIVRKSFTTVASMYYRIVA